MIRVVRSGAEWTLSSDGEDVRVARQFLHELIGSGRSGYTQRSYAQGLAAFLRWLAEAKVGVGQVTRRVIVGYTRSLVDGARPLAAASINHRLSVLSSFFSWLLLLEEPRDGDVPRLNPVPAPVDRPIHRVAGRDAPARRRAELRRRIPIRSPRALETETAAQLVQATKSLRDKAILTLLWRTGARIGDWLSESDRHGVLGMAMADFNAKRRVVTIRLKGARDDHQVPVTEDFWAAWAEYVAQERGSLDAAWAWVGRRRGRDKPLRYDAFAAMLRTTATRLGVRAHAHMFRHGLAQAVTAISGVHVTQKVLGHRHLSTTAEFYARVDEAKVVAALEQAAHRPSAQASTATRWVFPYDDVTVRELERLADGSAQGPHR